MKMNPSFVVRIHQSLHGLASWRAIFLLYLDGSISHMQMQLIRLFLLVFLLYLTLQLLNVDRLIILLHSILLTRI